MRHQVFCLSALAGSVLAVQSAIAEPRDYPVENGSVTQGQAAFSVSAPDSGAVFSFQNPGSSTVYASFVLRLFSTTQWDPANDRIVLGVSSSESGALTNGASGDVLATMLTATLRPDPVSTGNGENLNFILDAQFTLPTSGSPLLWAFCSFQTASPVSLSVGNVADPNGTANYLVADGTAYEFSTDLGQGGNAWAVQFSTVPSPGAGALIGLSALIASRRRRA